MPDTLTAHYNFTQPEVGGSNDTWGDKLNADLASIDTLIFNLRTDVTALGAALTAASFTSNNSILAKNNAGAVVDVTVAEGTLLGRRAGGEIDDITLATLKTDLALNNVENYSRAQLKTYFDSLYAPVGGGGGGGPAGEPHTAILTEISTEGIGANQIWVGDGASSLTKKTISAYMQGLLATANVGALQTALGTLAVTASSMVSPGYVKLSNGLIIQWGSVSVPGDTRPTVNYPVAFTTFGVPTGSGGKNATDDPANCRIVAATNANFQVCNNDGGSATFWWIAVGK
jgi:hypothetical protein